jgi:hypothetical protein
MIEESQIGSVTADSAPVPRQGGDDTCRRAAECQAQRLDAARDGRQATACTCFPQQGERQYC